jgi:hypothetical protein
VTVPPVDPRATQRAALRRAVLNLVVGIVLLDAIAMTVYYFAGIEHAPTRTRWIFVIGWSVITALLAGILLRRVRLVRFAGRR